MAGSGALKPPTGAERIAAERQRQVEGEGWMPDHDDKHWREQLAWAAACYAAPGPIYRRGADSAKQVSFIDPWPWDARWDKRKTVSRIRDLEKAGALIAAEIDRLLRVVEANPL